MLWGEDLSGTLQGAGGVGGLISVTDTSGTYYPIYDGNGNIMVYVDSSGNKVAEYTYDPFGKLLSIFGTKANDFAFRFSTKYFDSETGLYYYGFRYYNPELGRWLSRDPIGENGGVNLYRITNNDTVNNVDYLGLTPTSNALAFYTGLMKAIKDLTNPSEKTKCCNGKPYDPHTHCCCIQRKDAIKYDLTLRELERLQTRADVEYNSSQTRTYYGIYDGPIEFARYFFTWNQCAQQAERLKVALEGVGVEWWHIGSEQRVRTIPNAIRNMDIFVNHNIVTATCKCPQGSDCPYSGETITFDALNSDYAFNNSSYEKFVKDFPHANKMESFWDYFKWK